MQNIATKIFLSLRSLCKTIQINKILYSRNVCGNPASNHFLMKCPLRNLSHFIIPRSPATIDSLFSPTRMSHKISDNGALDETSNKNISMLSENSEWPIYFFTERSRFQAVTKNPDNRFCSIIFLNHALSFSSWLNGDIRNLYRLYDNLVYKWKWP